ncbi:MAG: hypothetical protein ABSC77_05350 [Terracidiphilus sp.]|jgi:hypothetical protein
MSAPKHVIKITLGIVWLFLSALAHADSITLTLDSNWGDYSEYTWISNGTTYTEPVGPYMAILNGGGYSNKHVLLFCYDMNSDTNVGTGFTGSAEPVTSFSNPTYTEIMQSTYLINELADDGGINAPLATRGAISLAIWEIMNPTSTSKSTPFPSDPAAQPYEIAAAAAVNSGAWTTADADQYETWAPDIVAIQRFGIQNSPEPASFVLTGLGLLCLGFLGLKSRIRAVKLV